MLSKTNSVFERLFFILFLFFTSLNADIQLIKKENNDSNTTLLIIGGIHGDEPGGYFAASILSTHYKVTSKNLWIVPNLNKKSIQSNSRGLNGDMNRKFSVIKDGDRDKDTVKSIKEIILSKSVSLVLNLHDGHGFYRKENHSKIFNPNAWGQTCVIDQCALSENQPFGNLGNIASTVKENMNKKLLQKHHSFDVRNTNTKFDDESMQHSLTYFAVTNHKPAFAIETSKHLSSLSQKVFYQLSAIEEFMKIMKISYSRSFKLNIEDIEKIIKEYGTLEINSNILLNLDNIKKYLRYIPIKSNNNVFKFSHPLGSVKRIRSNYLVFIGNKKITTLSPEFFQESDGCPEQFHAEVDGTLGSYPKTSSFSAKDSFKVLKDDGFRVNVIGYKSKLGLDESGINIDYKSISKRFSIDKDNKVYRVEFYNGDKFCFMSTVHFE